jgi:diaminopimelate epimerase
MTLNFVKMTGAGNDFILADNRAGGITLTSDQVRHLCDRHFGIGADGLILLIQCDDASADWAWQFQNADGSDAEMCGNGARCFARYIRQVTQWQRPEVTFKTAAGIITARFVEDQVSVELTPPNNFQPSLKLATSQGSIDVHSINTGVPHAVVFVPDADQAMVQSLGREIREHTQFKPRGTNVNFVQRLGPGSIRVRTYERGVEGETLACGTGVTASALVLAALDNVPSPIRVQVQGGDQLEIQFRGGTGDFTEVRLVGPASWVFEGTITIPDNI